MAEDCIDEILNEHLSKDIKSFSVSDLTSWISYSQSLLDSIPDQNKKAAFSAIVLRKLSEVMFYDQNTKLTHQSDDKIVAINRTKWFIGGFFFAVVAVSSVLVLLFFISLFI